MQVLGEQQLRRHVCELVQASHPGFHHQWVWYADHHDPKFRGYELWDGVWPIATISRRRSITQAALLCFSLFYSTREGKPLSKNLSLDLPWSKFYLLYKEILHHGWSKRHPNMRQQPCKRSSHHGSFMCYLSKNQTVRMTVSFKIYAISNTGKHPSKFQHQYHDVTCKVAYSQP